MDPADRFLLNRHWKAGPAARPPARIGPLRAYIPPERPDPLDRRLTNADRDWLRPGQVGPPPPPRGPRRPRTTFDGPRPGPRPAAAGYEPMPCHPKWMVALLGAWAAVWLALYVASALLLRG